MNAKGPWPFGPNDQYHAEDKVVTVTSKLFEPNLEVRHVFPPKLDEPVDVQGKMNFFRTFSSYPNHQRWKEGFANGSFCILQLPTLMTARATKVGETRLFSLATMFKPPEISAVPQI